jgi:CheY-like chemotaxis protein
MNALVRRLIPRGAAAAGSRVAAASLEGAREGHRPRPGDRVRDRQAARLGVSSATAPAPERGRETVLLVEDEAAVRDLASEILVEHGYTVLTAVPDGALTLVARHPGDIHLLLTDVIMPQISGPVLAANVGRLRPETKVLFMSGYTDDAIVPKGVFDDPARLLTKPFRAGDLLAKVREVLDRE